MAAVSRAEAVWQGDLTSGGGRVAPASGAFPELGVTWAGRTERSPGTTSPEELLAAAHAACFSMAFSNGLAKAGHVAERLVTTAEVTFVPGTGITSSHLTVRGRVPGIDAPEFERLAAEAKDGCPVSRALHGNVELKIEAALDG
jgi:lipoyl-dependent peroxiredoxin